MGLHKLYRVKIMAQLPHKSVQSAFELAVRQGRLHSDLCSCVEIINKVRPVLLMQVKQAVNLANTLEYQVKYLANFMQMQCL